jgi:hypothetical protein
MKIILINSANFAGVVGFCVLPATEENVNEFNMLR